MLHTTIITRLCLIKTTTITVTQIVLLLISQTTTLVHTFELLFQEFVDPDITQLPMSLLTGMCKKMATDGHLVEALTGSNCPLIYALAHILVLLTSIRAVC